MPTPMAYDVEWTPRPEFDLRRQPCDTLKEAVDLAFSMFEEANAAPIEITFGVLGVQVFGQRQLQEAWLNHYVRRPSPQPKAIIYVDPMKGAETPNVEPRS
jgi:hypothetical protein